MESAAWGVLSSAGCGDRQGEKVKKRLLLKSLPVSPPRFRGPLKTLLHVKAVSNDTQETVGCDTRIVWPREGL